MAKFRKAIVSAGSYLVSDGNGGRHTQFITADRLSHWANQFKKMKKAGVAIPAPWLHTKDAVPVQMGNDGSLPRSDWNAGFWKDFVVKNNNQGVPTLYGVVEVPGDPNDVNTPAGKVGKTVTETSIYARPSFTDGKGNEYKDVIMHGALVTHPIEPGQENFEQVEEGLVIAMSDCTGLLMSADSTPFSQKGNEEYPGDDEEDESLDLENAPTGDLKTVMELLSKIGVILPKDTTDENFKERLSVALQQKVSGDDEDDDDEGSLTKPPKEADKESEPMLMSTTPKTPEITAEVIMSHPAYKELESKNTQLFGVMNNQAKAARGARINALIQSKRITKEYSDANLVPLLNSFQMSFDSNGNEVLTALDVTLKALEAIPAPAASTTVDPTKFTNGTVQQLAPFLMSSIAPEGTDTPTHPIPGFLSGGMLSEEDAEKLGDQLAATML